MNPEFAKLSDQELVTMTLKDHSAFGYLIERYEAKLKRYVFRIGLTNIDDQLDVLQEIFIKAYKNLNSFDTALSFSSWIYRIAHNETISWYRKQKVRPEGHLAFDGEEVLKMLSIKDESAEALFDQQINAEELAKALEKIDKKYQEVIILRYFEDKDYQEISDILKIPAGTVGTLISRGKKQLQNELNPNNLRI